MNAEMDKFIRENKRLKIEKCRNDKDFLIIKNITEKELSQLCAKYGASGSMHKDNSADIGNFGKYK